MPRRAPRAPSLIVASMVLYLLYYLLDSVRSSSLNPWRFLSTILLQSKYNSTNTAAYLIIWLISPDVTST
ncbi:hypothetical protein M422DRAFT_38482, partial [Sphaerobolus stellatus SS14]